MSKKIKCKVLTAKDNWVNFSFKLTDEITIIESEKLKNKAIVVIDGNQFITDLNYNELTQQQDSL